MWEFYVVSVGVCVALMLLGVVMEYAKTDADIDLLALSFTFVIALIPLANLYLIWAFTEAVMFNIGVREDGE